MLKSVFTGHYFSQISCRQQRVQNSYQWLTHPLAPPLLSMHIGFQYDNALIKLATLVHSTTPPPNTCHCWPCIVTLRHVSFALPPSISSSNLVIINIALALLGFRHAGPFFGIPILLISDLSHLISKSLQQAFRTPNDVLVYFLYISIICKEVLILLCIINRQDVSYSTFPAPQIQHIF